VRGRIVITPDGEVEGDLEAAARAIAGARGVTALTGAGVSVESGIPDFRSPGGLWSVFDPMEYATLSCFLDDPAKAWTLYRALGKILEGKTPNPAHRALAELEEAGIVKGLVTQNVDGLHQAAGSRTVIEIHGEATHLQCLRCHGLEPVVPAHLEPGPVPVCGECRSPLKPNLVLFEEPVRRLEAISALVRRSELMLVAGTSCEVAPASLLPEEVLARRGSIVELNLEPTQLTAGGLGPSGFFVQGPLGTTLPLLAAAVLEQGAAGGSA
jgi:NAD-dependent deacetylase